MNKKFFSVFALAALLVAAMAGAAMAAASGDIVSVNGTPNTHVSSLDYAGGGKGLTVSGDLYYYSGAPVAKLYDISSLDVKFDGVLTKATGWHATFGASGDKAITIVGLSKPVSPDFAKKSPDVITYGFAVSFDAWPKTISIDGFALSSDAASADILLTVKKVAPVKLDAATGNLVTGTTTPVTLTAKGFSFSGAAVRVLSGDNELKGYASDDAKLKFTFDISSGNTIKITPKTGGPGNVGETFRFALVGGQLLVPDAKKPANKVKVLGVANSDDLIVSFDVKVTEDGGDDPIISVDVIDGVKLKPGLTAVSSDYVRSGDIETYTAKPGIASIDVLGSSVLVSMDVKSISGTAALPLKATIEVSKIGGSVVSNDFKGTWSTKGTEQKLEVLNKGYALRYQYVENVDGVGTVALIGQDSTKPWGDAIKEGYVSFDAGNLVLNYVITDEEIGKGVVYDKDAGLMYIADGVSNKKLYDPVWFTKKQTSGGWSGDSGCNAGFGAFALLGLAGAAVLLRRKD